MKVEFARGKSHVLGRLDGTLKIGEGGAGAKKIGGEGGEVASLQQAIFGAPPGAAAPGMGAGGGLPAIPPPPASGAGTGAGGKLGDKEKGSGEKERGMSEGPQGVKRTREESDEEGAPMEEESDDDVEMEQESGDSD